jgi:hypothetical protein
MAVVLELSLGPTDHILPTEARLTVIHELLLPFGLCEMENVCKHVVYGAARRVSSRRPR